MYSSECPLFPQIWVDDWIMFANSRDALQTLIRRTAALLRKYGMAIKPEKVQWIANDQITEVQLQYEGETIMRKPYIIYMGLKLDPTGDPNIHFDHRLAQGIANWTRYWKNVASWKGMPWTLRPRIY